MRGTGMSEDMNKKVNEVIGESVGVAPEKAKSPVANSKSKWVFAGVVAVAAIAIIVEGVLLAQSKSQIELLTRQLDSAETEMNDTRSGQIELTDADAKSGISVIELTYIEEQLNLLLLEYHPFLQIQIPCQCYYQLYVIDGNKLQHVEKEHISYLQLRSFPHNLLQTRKDLYNQ